MQDGADGKLFNVNDKLLRSYMIVLIHHTELAAVGVTHIRHGQKTQYYKEFFKDGKPVKPSDAVLAKAMEKKRSARLRLDIELEGPLPLPAPAQPAARAAVRAAPDSDSSSSTACSDRVDLLPEPLVLDRPAVGDRVGEPSEPGISIHGCPNLHPPPSSDL